MINTRIMSDVIEVKRLTVIDIVDNETDPLSSPCCCMKPIPNKSSSTSSRSDPDKRPCTYTQELMTVVRNEKALDFNSMCYAAHGMCN